MKWTNDAVMEFLDLYEAEPIIWNADLPAHKDRNQIYEAWIRIKDKFSVDCTVQELKHRKQLVLATYRKIARRKYRYHAKGMPYTPPEWFAFEKMDSFLHPVYKPKGLYQADPTVTKVSDIEMSDDYEDIGDINGDRSLDGEDTASDKLDDGSTTSISKRPLIKKRRTMKSESPSEALVEMELHNLEKIAAAYKPKLQTKQHQQPKDECELFCELLCMKLKALDDEGREIAMHEINNVVFQHRKSKKQETPEKPEAK